MTNNSVSTNIITHKLLLDNTQYQSKPTETDIGVINNRIVKHPVDINIVELSKQVTSPNGKSWVPAFLQGKRNDKSWQSQSVFALDFDSGMPFDQVLEKLRGYGLDCTFAYETFSSKPDLQKFRVVFQLDQSTICCDYRNSIHQTLMFMFSEQVDKSCADRSRMFFGGKSLIYTNYNYCLDLALIDEITTHRNINEATDLIAKTKKQKNYSQVLKRHREKCEKNDNRYINNIKNSKNLTKLDSIQVVVENLRKNVKIFDDMILGKWLDYPTYLGLVTNLVFIRGGLTWYKESLDAMERNHKDTVAYKQALSVNPRFLDKLRALPTVIKDYVKKQGYNPQQLRNFSPYKEDWVYKNLLSAAKKKGIVRLYQVQYKSVEQAREELKQVYRDVSLSKDTKIHVIKAPTGLGKSELCTDSTNSVFAMPNHQLKDEMFKRMVSPCKLTPSNNLLPQEIQNRLQRFYGRGANRAATRYLYDVAKTNKQVEEYCSQNDDCYRSTETVLTTHQKALFIDWQHDTIIFDEDPLQVLLPTGKITLNDLVRVKDSIVNINDKSNLESLIDDILHGRAKYMDKKFEDLRAIEDEVLTSDTKYESEILHFFDAQYFKVDPRDPATIYFVSKYDLPQDKKIVILSATANEAIYKQLFGDRLVFHDIGNVKPSGVILQDSRYSCSRTSLNKQLEYVVTSILKSGNHPTITFNSFKLTLANLGVNVATDVHFGKLTGFDTLKGTDINVVGTYFNSPIAIELYASVLELPFESDEVKTNAQIVEHNGFRFWFNTYTNLHLRNLQFHFLESEGRQAMGRARVNTERCKVVLYSNYPFQEACVTDEEKALGLQSFEQRANSTLCDFVNEDDLYIPTDITDRDYCYEYEYYESLEYDPLPCDLIDATELDYSYM